MYAYVYVPDHLHDSHDVILRPRGCVNRGVSGKREREEYREPISNGNKESEIRGKNGNKGSIRRVLIPFPRILLNLGISRIFQPDLFLFFFSSSFVFFA